MGARLSTIENYIGKTYGRLTVIADLGCISAGNRRVVTAVCECGVVKDYLMQQLKRGYTKSCGCILVEKRYGADFINKIITTDDSKICVSCKILKHNEDFHKAGNGRLQSKCKECMAQYKKERYWKDHANQLEKHSKSRTKPENILQRKGYYEKNKNEYRERHLKYMQDETKRKHKKEASQKRHNKRYRTDPEYNILIKIRARIRTELNRKRNGKLKNKTTLAYLGCSYEFLKSHIESLFTDGMTWDKVLSGEIHLDHIRPCSSFQLTDPEQQMACFNWKNLQPLWWEDNLRKSSSYQPDQEKT